jgi:hypothetical protein
MAREECSAVSGDWEQTNPSAELTGEETARLSALRQSGYVPTPQLMAFKLADAGAEDRQAILDDYHERVLLNGDPVCVVHRLTIPKPAYIPPSTHIREVDEGDSIIRRRGVCQTHAEALPAGPIVIRN